MNINQLYITLYVLHKFIMNQSLDLFLEEYNTPLVQKYVKNELYKNEILYAEEKRRAFLRYFLYLTFHEPLQEKNKGQELTNQRAYRVLYENSRSSVYEYVMCDSLVHIDKHHCVQLSHDQVKQILKDDTDYFKAQILSKHVDDRIEFSLTTKHIDDEIIFVLSIKLDNEIKNDFLTQHAKRKITNISYISDGLPQI